MLTQGTLEWKELVAYFQLDKISSDILAISSMLDIKSNEGWGGIWVTFTTTFIF